MALFESCQSVLLAVFTGYREESVELAEYYLNLLKSVVNILFINEITEERIELRTKPDND